MDKLVCLLCQHPYREPKMCSNCSEIFCTRCIQNYIAQNHLCPTCGHVLPDLADCTRLIAEVKSHVRGSRKPKIKTCTTHGLPLKYQCEDCQTAICADCGIISEEHRGHSVVPRSPSLPKNKLRQYLVTLEECILKDHSRHQQLVLQREVLKSEVRWCRNKLRQYYQEMSVKLQREADKMMDEIVIDIQDKEKRLEKLKKIKEDVNEILGMGEAVDEIILQRVSEQNDVALQLQEGGEEGLFKLEGLIDEYKDGTFFQFNRKTLNTLKQVYPDYVNHTYELDYEGNRYSEIKYSESFYLYGQEWRLKIYPTGNGQAPGHLSLFLELISSPSSISSSCLEYFFRLELISLNAAGKTISKQYRSPFTEGDCWGYNDFVQLGELDQFLTNGHLVFVVGIRNCSYFDVCETMKNYIRKLEEEKNVLQQLIGGRNSSGISSMEVYSLDSSRSSRLTQNFRY